MWQLSQAVRRLPQRELLAGRSGLQAAAIFHLPTRRFFRTEPIPPELFHHAPSNLTTLSNGLRVASQWTPDETVTVGVFVDSGSRYETKANNGVAHFLEHMVFKGTQRRSRVQLEREIEDMGGHLNAYTAREQTVYYAKTFKKDLPQAVDILADILTHSKFSPAAVEEERHVIMREMEEVEKSPEEVIFDRLHMTAFRDSPLGFTILGPPENIQRINRQDILDYVRENYTADRLVIAAAGDVSHKQLVELVEANFGQYRRGAEPVVQVKKEKPYFCGSTLVHRDDFASPFAYVAVGYQAVSWTHPAQPVFMVMQSLLGVYDRMNEGLVPGILSLNRAKNNVANKLTIGCAENFAGFNTCYKDTGLFGFYVRANQNAMFHAIDELFFAVNCLSYCVTEEEVQTAKRQLQLSLFGNLDTTTALCEDLGRHILVYGRRIPPAELYKRIDLIDSDEVRRVGWEHLYDQEIALAGVGALKGLVPYNQLRRMSKFNRW